MDSQSNRAASQDNVEGKRRREKPWPTQRFKPTAEELHSFNILVTEILDAYTALPDEEFGGKWMQWRGRCVQRIQWLAPFVRWLYLPPLPQLISDLMLDWAVSLRTIGGLIFPKTITYEDPEKHPLDHRHVACETWVPVRDDGYNIWWDRLGE